MSNSRNIPVVFHTLPRTSESPYEQVAGIEVAGEELWTSPDDRMSEVSSHFETDLPHRLALGIITYARDVISPRYQYPPGRRFLTYECHDFAASVGSTAEPQVYDPRFEVRPLNRARFRAGKIVQRECTARAVRIGEWAVIGQPLSDEWSTGYAYHSMVGMRGCTLQVTNTQGYLALGQPQELLAYFKQKFPNQWLDIYANRGE